MFERINLNTDLNNISRNICSKYGLGDYIADEVIEIGYEDFNYIITSANGKYFAKIFYSGRNEQESQEYIERMEKVSETGVSFPRLHKSDGESLYHLTINNVIYRICIFDYIDGQNFFMLGENPSEKELQEIARQMRIIHGIDLKPNFIYDSWAINNFGTEFNKKRNTIPVEYLDRIQKIYEQYTSLDLSKLPHAFIHGDIINTNIMRDKNGKLWIIDFAVSNYLPRIQELAVSSSNLCSTVDSKETTYKRIQVLLDEYTNGNPLTEQEKANFQLFYEVSNAMFMIQSSYQRSIGNTSEENDFWLKKGLTGLQFSDKKCFSDVLEEKERAGLEYEK